MYVSKAISQLLASGVGGCADMLLMYYSKHIVSSCWLFLLPSTQLIVLYSLLLWTIPYCTFKRTLVLLKHYLHFLSLSDFTVNPTVITLTTTCSVSPCSALPFVSTSLLDKISLSLVTDEVLQSIKIGTIKPFLWIPTLNSGILAIHRPVSNL